MISRLSVFHFAGGVNRLGQRHSLFVRIANGGMGGGKGYQCKQDKQSAQERGRSQEVRSRVQARSGKGEQFGSTRVATLANSPEAPDGITHRRIVEAMPASNNPTSARSAGVASEAKISGFGARRREGADSRRRAYDQALRPLAMSRCAATIGTSVLANDLSSGTSPVSGRRSG